jgi:hypothetical protein
MRIHPGMVWVRASVQEARRAGAEAVDVDHLLLGLLAVGGTAARVLGRRGITLDGMRRRVGSDGAQATDGDAYWHPTDRARAVVDSSGSAAGTVDLLLRLLDEPTVRDLVEAEGAAADALVDELRATPDGYTAEPVPPDPELLPTSAYALRSATFLSAPAARAVEALTDPRVLRAFAWGPGVEVDDEGLTGRRTRRGRTTTLRAELRSPSRRDGDPASGASPGPWVVSWVFSRDDGQVMKYERFEVSEAPGGCDVVRVHGYRVVGLAARLLQALSGGPKRWDEVFVAHQLAADIAAVQ